MTIGERVRALRAQKGWTQDELLAQARRFLPAGEKFARASLSRIEKDHRRPNSGTLQALARALGATPEYLLGLEGAHGLGAGQGEAGDSAEPGAPAPDVAPILARILKLPAARRQQVCVVINDLLTALAVPPANGDEEAEAAQVLRDIARSRATRAQMTRSRT